MMTMLGDGALLKALGLAVVSIGICYGANLLVMPGGDFAALVGDRLPWVELQWLVFAVIITAGNWLLMQAFGLHFSGGVAISFLGSMIPLLVTMVRWKIPLDVPLAVAIFGLSTLAVVLGLMLQSRMPKM